MAAWGPDLRAGGAGGRDAPSLRAQIHVGCSKTNGDRQAAESPPIVRKRGGGGKAVAGQVIQRGEHAVADPFRRGAIGVDEGIQQATVTESRGVI